MTQENLERFELRNARYLAQRYMCEFIRPGDVVVDATMGNGYDTLFLCELVGDKGMVHAFDVQEQAVARTRERIEEAGFAERVVLHLRGHEHMAEHVPPGVNAVMFNLGWLPGAQHGVTTRTETTIEALSAALSLVRPGGLVSVCIYPGHEEGTKELYALKVFASGLSVRAYNVLWHEFSNAAVNTPQLVLIQKNLLSAGA